MDFRDIKEFFRDTFKYIIVIIVVLVIALYVATFTQVVGPSMEPNYKDGDVVLLLKAHYKLFEVKRNDIISFESEGVRYLIKRVIGLPGEKVEYKDNVLYIDGKAYQENLYDGIKTKDFKLSQLGYDVIPEDMYLVLGDNRGNSYDSRNFGLITKKQIIGKCIFQIWPINRIGMVF